MQRGIEAPHFEYCLTYSISVFYNETEDEYAIHISSKYNTLNLHPRDYYVIAKNVYSNGNATDVVMLISHTGLVIIYYVQLLFVRTVVP